MLWCPYNNFNAYTTTINGFELHVIFDGYEWSGLIIKDDKKWDLDVNSYSLLNTQKALLNLYKEKVIQTKWVDKKNESTTNAWLVPFTRNGVAGIRTQSK